MHKKIIQDNVSRETLQPKI